jgi:DNA-binding NarL/FixJ family response regulator
MTNQTGFNIALVDDHALLRKAINFKLSRMGYNVMMEAENGREFLDKLAAAPYPADLCLLDINMPVMNGFETAVELKKKWPGMKILFFSMNNGSVYINKALEVGADGFVCKDAPSEELNKALHELLHPHPHQQVA